MKRFEPSRTYSSPSRRAVVRIAAESEPEPDSVSAYAGSHSPEREPRQPALLLLVAAGELEPERAELLHREDQAARRADLRDLLDRDQREQRPGAEPAVLLGEEEPEDVVLAEQLDDVPRELVRRVDLGRARRDPLARERADELAQLPLLVGQRIEDAHTDDSSLGRPRGSAARCQAGSSWAHTRHGSARSARAPLARLRESDARRSGRTGPRQMPDAFPLHRLEPSSGRASRLSPVPRHRGRTAPRDDPRRSREAR